MDNNKLPAPASALGGPGAPAQGATNRFLVVFGTKGGVGKTVVATNLAVSLAKRIRKPVCLIDLDLMGPGDAARMLNVTVPRPLVDLMGALKREKPIESIALESALAVHSSGVHVATCLANPRQISQLDPQALTVLLQALKRRYEYIVVDGGRGFPDSLITAFDAANLILLVATPDVMALYQTKWAINLVESLLFPLSMVKVVLNRAESLGSVDVKDVRAALSCEIIAELPSEGRIVGLSVNQGSPFVLAYRMSRVSEAMTKLADALVTRPSLYVSQQDVPRHRRTEAGTTPAEAPAGGPIWSTRLFASSEDGGASAEPVDDLVLMKQHIHERLMEELDLKRLDLGMMTNNTQVARLRQKIEQVVANLLAKEMGGVISAHEVRARLVKEIVDEALGLGPLEELLADPEVSDILVNNKDHIYVERRGRLELTSKKFVSNDQVRAVIERIVAPLGRRIDEASPMVDARLPDGSRVNVIIPPLSIKGPTLSIRKFATARYTLEDLIRFGTLNRPMADVIRACVLARKNFVISGGTGSGKTTLLNVISAFIPEAERIITIEDAAELKLAQTHWVSLEARPSNIEGKGQVAIRDLFRNALRMRPDRIIIGECRGAETLDMLQAMNTGHDGSVTTIHANSPKDVIARLDSMVLMSNVDLPVRAIREMVASGIHLIIHTARLSDGSRKILAIAEIAGLAHEAEVQFQELFVYRQTAVATNGAVLGEFVATGKLPTFLNELKVKGIELVLPPA